MSMRIDGPGGPQEPSSLSQGLTSLRSLVDGAIKGAQKFVMGNSKSVTSTPTQKNTSTIYASFTHLNTVKVTDTTFLGAVKASLGKALDKALQFIREKTFEEDFAKFDVGSRQRIISDLQAQNEPKNSKLLETLQWVHEEALKKERESS